MIVTSARTKSAAFVAALAIALSTLVVAPPTSAAASEVVSEEVSVAAQGGFRVEGVRIRRNPDDTSDILGLGYTSHSVNVRCTVPRPNFTSLNYLTNLTTGVSGYSPSAYVWWNGTIPFC